MRTFTSYVLSAKRYLELKDVPKTQDAQTIGGGQLISYDIVKESNFEYLNGIKQEVKTVVIEVDSKFEVKKDDRILHRGTWYKVDSVDLVLPESKRKNVKLWKNLVERMSVKHVTLK